MPHDQLGKYLNDNNQVTIGAHLAVEQQQAGLGGNRHLDLIAEFQATAAFKRFIEEEFLCIALELLLQFGDRGTSA